MMMIVMKVILVKEVMSCDVSPVAMFTTHVVSCLPGVDMKKQPYDHP